MEKQTTHTILMIEPVAFGFNEQTAVNNHFQQNDNATGQDVQSKALAEFNELVVKLQSKGIEVIVVKDTIEPSTPDSIFPNNWISFHADGRVALYPMYAPNRRAERRTDILHLLTDKCIQSVDIVDYTPWEKVNRFLEGTGSLILDRQHKIAYAAISERTDHAMFIQFCEDFYYHPVCFIANQTKDNNRLPIYHTNVMMCVAEQYAVVCLNAIDNECKRKVVVDALVVTNKEIIEISEAQMSCFAGNMLQVENKEGKQFLVMSQSAHNSLTQNQIERLTFYNEIITAAIPTIEKYGGGSVRCMMAEVF
ncbi:MAG TPA: arginine deiminase-related protein [Paludibacter sp.]|nr:arginine deiminase-related protein [Paludibacter sp.]